MKITKTAIVLTSCVAVVVGITFLSLFIWPDHTTETKRVTDDFICSNFKPGLQMPIKPEQINDSDFRTYDVIVIGAGISGLEAAHQLKSKGMDVLVLEGRDRIGGRAYTYNSSGTALDLGGSWIHGFNKNRDEPENPLYKIATRNHIEIIQTDLTTTLYDSFGHQVDDDSYYLYMKYERFAEKYNAMLGEDQKKKLSIQDVLDKYYDTIPNMTKKDLAEYRYTMEWSYDMDQAANTSELAFSDSLDDQYFNNDKDEAILVNGYTQIANCLASGLNIKHANVTRVDYRDRIVENYTDRTILVTAGDEKPFRARYVVSTLPLGVLQKNTVEFEPIFPQEKIDAIKHLKMGTMDKVYLIYNTTEPFWKTDSTWVNRITAIDESSQCSTSDKNWKFFFNLYNYDHQPILLAFNTGNPAVELENKTDEEIGKEVTCVLQNMFPDKTIPNMHMIRTHWATDPLAGGSYSSIGVSASPDDFDRLAEPIDNKIFFAGEATNKYYFGTVHAAYISGYRAAQEIQNLEGSVDSGSAQLEHGIKKWDIICERGLVLVVENSTKDVECTPKINR